jgi:hypothetical protein
MNGNDNVIIRSWKEAPNEQTRIEALKIIVEDYDVLLCVFLRGRTKCALEKKWAREVPN